MGRLAWAAIINQFGSVFKGDLKILSTNRFVHRIVHGSGHIRIGFNPDFENPDPTKFPKAEVSVEMVSRANQEATQANQGIIP